MHGSRLHKYFYKHMIKWHDKEGMIKFKYITLCFSTWNIYLWLKTVFLTTLEANFTQNSINLHTSSFTTVVFIGYTHQNRKEKAVEKNVLSQIKDGADLRPWAFRTLKRAHHSPFSSSCAHRGKILIAIMESILKMRYVRPSRK